MTRTRPNDCRGFIHKKLFGVVKKVASVGSSFVPGGTVVRAALGIIGGGGRVRRQLQFAGGGGGGGAGGGGCPPGSWRDSQGRCRLDRGANTPTNPIRIAGTGTDAAAVWKEFGDTGARTTQATAATCIPPARLDPRTGECRVFLGEQSGRDDVPMGETVMGKYGAAYIPGSMVVDRAVCLPGDVVGKDGFCYAKRSLSNKERLWPRGRQPLLTGGEMRAISIASRAAHRFARTQKRLEHIGMIKRPATRRALPRPHQHALPAPAVSV